MVQGVFFRQSTRQQAMLYGLTGWVRNRSDGSVEGQATGDAAMLAALREWLGRGPETAVVQGLEWEPTDLCRFDDFQIR